MANWFPEGLEDPNLALIRFDADKVDYWGAAAAYSRLADETDLLEPARGAADRR